MIHFYMYMDEMVFSEALEAAIFILVHLIAPVQKKKCTPFLYICMYMGTHVQKQHVHH